MGENITLNQLRNACEIIDDRLDELEALTAEEKQGLYKPVQITIQTTGWSTDSTVTLFPMRYDVTAEEITKEEIVAVDVAPGSVGTARSANFATVETYDGGFCLRAKKVPTEPIQAQYHIMNSAVYVAGGGEE